MQGKPVGYPLPTHLSLSDMIYHITKHPTTRPTSFAFFGSSSLSVFALEELRATGLTPRLVVTFPGRRQGRGMRLTLNPVRAWADSEGIEALTPEALDDAVAKRLQDADCPFFLVVAYGKILRRNILDIPPLGILNIHPSLLPRFRGASPVRSTILANETPGVSVMLLDEEMDHGPIIAQKKVEWEEWPPHALSLEEALIREGARLLAQVLPEWLRGELLPQAQNHDIATYCKKLAKEDGLLDFSLPPRDLLIKIRALEGWPGSYAFFKKRGGKTLRVQILDAHLEGSALVIDSVKPEGKGAMRYTDFTRSGARLT